MCVCLKWFWCLSPFFVKGFFQTHKYPFVLLLAVGSEEQVNQVEKIIVLDFGGQYAHLIANRIRRLHVYSEIRDPDSPVEELADASGFILSGGPAAVFEEGAPPFNEEILRLGKPMLGICYGHQLLMHVLGGKVRKGKVHEFGVASLETKANPLFAGLNSREQVWMSHADTVLSLPPGFEGVGKTSDCTMAAVYNGQKNIFGVQFHPEVTHTENGMRMLGNFLNVCKCKKNWTMRNYVEQKVSEIRSQVGKKKVFLLASGGVDSTVCLALLNKALGPENVKALHIDNGFMRANESQKVKEALNNHGFGNFVMEDASDYFLEKTKGLVDPEEKRKAIGNAFIEVQQRVLKNIGLNEDDWLLGQGTIYPDTIESGRTKHAKVIKTHHNRVEIIQKMIEQGRIIEPLDQLYKDEVREVGVQLGLPAELIQRHPFPGPGLGVRCLCSSGNEKPVALDVQNRVREIASRNGYDSLVLPLRSVGVQGDNRTYKHPAVVIGKGDWKRVEIVSTTITNEIRDINRVVWLVKGIVSPVTKPAALTHDRLELLRKADALVERNLREMDLYDSVWQFPVVLVPMVCGDGSEAVIFRPVYSNEAMTARFANLPFSFVEQTADEIMEIHGMGAVLYDVTHKPPGTIEWE